MQLSFTHSRTQEKVYSRAASLLEPVIGDLKRVKKAGKSPGDAVHLASDATIEAAVEKALSEIGIADISYVAVVGIGGSSSGAKAVYDALRRPGMPRMLFFETTDARGVALLLSEMKEHATKAEEVLVAIVSKSGDTLETMADAEIVVSSLRETLPDIEKRVIVISDEDSPLLRAAEARGLFTLPMPIGVRGRYSVFSASGLLPLRAAGLSISDLRAGAIDMETRCLLLKAEDNPAIMSAGFLEYWFSQGARIHDLFYFAPELKSLGAWSRQLLGESIGKDGKGITPTISIGSTDLHSTAQLHLGGGVPMTALMVSREPLVDVLRVPEERVFPELIPQITGRSLGELMRTLHDAAVLSYSAKNIPLIELEFQALSEKELGAYLEWKMFETIYLAALLDVDAFTEPDVNEYKKIARTMLKDDADSA